MSSTEPVIGEYGGQVIIELAGELDIERAVKLAAALSAAVACRPQIDVDLTPCRPWSSPPATPPHPVLTMTWVIEGAR